jgi:hypothetical protein
MPRTRFHLLAAINETNGKIIWNLPIGISGTAIADGYLLGTDTDNGMQYAIGKGKTATSVTAPTTGIALGTSVLIQGSVIDMSPGKPNTPAIADEDMSEWMDYLYGQNATLLNSPPSPDGVPVRIYAIGSDGTVTEVGMTTSDSSGKYALAWTPEKEDTYRITATFDGSESYFGSWDETGLLVQSAADDAPTASPLNYDAITNTIVTSVAIAAIAIIVAVILVGLLVLRKRQ